MSEEFHQEFNALRRRLADYIEWYLKEDCGHKSYEGTWELLCSYPSYFEDENASSPPNFYRITLHCYIIGPSRHYHWDGNTWEDALEKCKRDVDSWIFAEYEEGR